MSLVEIATAVSHQFVAAPVQIASFWLSVILPLFYIPLIFDGLGAKVLPLFVGLLSFHLITLFLGRNYRQENA
ncbi:hypothetical protein [Haladaptatus cibarius]|uniref:hypothetical protein n=1 Tax=Haladaptatus cibarius TaxID=453847 RepID=UPI00067937CA|nr:hypothetical protein [Haladaptatus cibarius]